MRLRSIWRDVCLRKTVNAGAPLFVGSSRLSMIHITPWLESYNVFLWRDLTTRNQRFKQYYFSSIELTLLTKRLWRRFSPVSFAKFWGTSFFIEHCRKTTSFCRQFYLNTLVLLFTKRSHRLKLNRR